MGKSETKGKGVHDTASVITYDPIKVDIKILGTQPFWPEANISEKDPDTHAPPTIR